MKLFPLTISSPKSIVSDIWKMLKFWRSYMLHLGLNWKDGNQNYWHLENFPSPINMHPKWAPQHSPEFASCLADHNYKTTPTETNEWKDSKLSSCSRWRGISWKKRIDTEPMNIITLQPPQLKQYNSRYVNVASPPFFYCVGDER